MRTVYSIDEKGYFYGETVARESPLEPGVYHMPAGAVEVPPPESADGERARWTGQTWTLEDIPRPPSPTLQDARTDALTKVDTAAETARLRYVTAGSAQAMVYREKLNEARACHNTASPDPADYPHLAAEVGITAETVQGVADVVLAQAETWAATSAVIEATRLAAKRDIAAAPTPEAVLDILDGLAWPQPV